MWWWLAGAIASEVCATLSLRASDGFSRIGPAILVVAGYAFAFFALSQALRLGMHIATAYAVWSAVGMAAIAVLGVVLYGESLGRLEVLGLVLVILGVVALQVGA